MTMEQGFELLRDVHIQELKTTARLYRHVKTGAQLLSLSNDDENKVFGINFRTPPRDSTGIAHILEHSVLCGSRKYPVKEPFVELLKGSLKTFLNAFTYPDKTCYPVASQNLQDFYNLVDVYLDAVFHPLIPPHILQQEGWHFELEALDAPLTYKGVVFNEMKGVYSSPESVLAEKSQQILFPDITYGLDSGGNPKEIPNLTYEQFKEFHRTYYHPSNARIFFYGDDDPTERLRLLDEALKEFDPIDVDSHIPLQAPFQEPRREFHPFAAGKQDSEAEEKGPKGMITVNWLLPETTREELNLAFHVLQYALLGMAGSPLRKALIDSGLGDDLAGVGLETDLRQMYFSVGLKGIAMKSADQVERLILDTLQQLATSGFDPETVEAALNTIEFQLRENNTGSYPRGLALMLRSLTSWLHDGDPIAPLAFEAPLNTIKSNLESDTGYLERLIREFLLENGHRVTLLLEPDTELTAREEAEERARLEAIKSNMSAEELERVAANTRELQRLQEAPDSPEALATIPTLKLSDLDRKNKIIPVAQLEDHGAKVLYHDLFTSGIAYLDIGHDLHHLPQEWLPYVRLFSRALTEIGTDTQDYVQLTRRISGKTGGIRPEIFTSSVQGQETASTWLFLRSKCMMHQVKDLFSILRDILLTVRLDNQARFRQMVLEEKAREEHKVVPNGHQVVNTRLRAHFSEADWASEKMSGASYLFFLRQLTQDVDQKWSEVLGVLEGIRRTLVNRAVMIFNVTLDEPNWNQFRPVMSDFAGALPLAESVPGTWSPSLPAPFEGMTIPAQVNYVGKGCNLYRLGYTPHGSAQVISGYLRTSWLWEKIRVQGGAYGAFCLFDRISGTFSYLSYRDPNLQKTLENFDLASRFLKDHPLSPEELTKGIIGAIGNLDAYQLPDAKGYLSLLRHLIGDSDATRQQMREEILGTTTENFRAFADMLDEVNKEGIVKILGPESALQELDSQKFQVMRVL